MSFCSPSNKDFKNTCYTLRELRLFAKHYNQFLLKNQKSHSPIDLSLSKRELLRALNDKFGNVHESKWMETQYMVDVSRNVKNNLKANFVPPTPGSWLINNKKWLTNFDIENVLEQYELEYPSFKFLGVHPIDFAATYNTYQCISPEICALDVKKSIKNRKTKIGIVFNLDRHDQSGSHWVTLVCSLSIEDKNFGCHYIDSTGAPVPPQIYALMLNIKDQISTEYKTHPNVKKFKLFQNLKQFQKGNTECGMFAIYFVTTFVSSNMSVPQILSKHITDNDVFKLRAKMFNPHINSPIL